MICEICKQEYDFCKYHHIQSRCYNGSNKSYNRVYVCDKHHELVHYGIIIIEGWFSSINGKILIWRKLGETTITGLEDPKVWLKPNYERIQELYYKRKQYE